MILPQLEDKRDFRFVKSFFVWLKKRMGVGALPRVRPYKIKGCFACFFCFGSSREYKQS